MTFVTIRARPGVCLTDGDRPDRVLAALRANARRHGVAIHACCLMPDHVHVVCSILPAGGDLAQWLCAAKSGASRRAGAPLWQRGYWDRTARREDDVVAMVEYTLANPVRKGLCEDWAAWPWSWSEWHDEDGPQRAG